MGVETPGGCGGATVGDAVDELGDFAPGELGNATISPIRQRLLFQDALDFIVRAIVALVAFQPVGNDVAEQIRGVGGSGGCCGLLALGEILTGRSPRFASIP
jgi:hypothetical protein